MAGNVWEWCLNEYDNPSETKLSGDARRVVRGGAWYGSPVNARASARPRNDPNLRNYGLGVRLACVAHIFTPLQWRGLASVFSTSPLRAHPPSSARVALPVLAGDYGFRPEAKD